MKEYGGISKEEKDFLIKYIDENIHGVKWTLGPIELILPNNKEYVIDSIGKVNNPSCPGFSATIVYHNHKSDGLGSKSVFVDAGTVLQHLRDVKLNNILN